MRWARALYSQRRRGTGRHGRTYRLFVIGVSLMLAFASGGPGLPASSPAQAADQLLTPATAAGDAAIAAPSNDKSIKRSRFVDVNFAMLPNPKKVKPEQGAADAGPRSYTLDLFGDATLVAEIDKLDVTPTGTGVMLTGKVRGSDPFSSVTLVTEDGVLVGNIRSDGKYFQIRPAGTGAHAVREIDEAQFPIDAQPAAGASPNAPADPLAGQADNAADTNNDIIDVLVAYTNGARAQVGSTAAMNSLIALALSETNTGFANSGVQQRIRIVDQFEVAYTEQAGGGIAGFQTDLNRLVSTSDGIMDTVHASRNVRGADFVTLIRTDDPANQLCGLAAMIFGGSTALTAAAGAPRAFNVTAQGCATGNFTFGHELGHTMGVRHNVENDPTNTPFTYAHGYCAPTGTPGYRTIMGVQSSCTPTNLPRLNYWSNPSVTVRGVPSGNATSADAERTLDETLPITRTFRAGIGPSNDSFSNPSNIAGALPQNRTQSTVHSTAEAGEATCGFSIDSSVWWTYTATTTGPLVIKTAGSNYDTTLGVYTGNAVNALTPVPFGCNDDSAPGLTSRVRINATAGTTYRIQVDGFGGAVGNLSLTIEPGQLAARPDFDPDGKGDMGVWTPANGQFFALKSNGGTYVNFAGGGNQIPVPGDYDGDGISDAAVFEPNGAVWFIKKSTGGITNVSLGAVGSTQIPVPADYDGDGKLDIAVWIPGNGFWLVQKSTGGFLSNIIGSSSSIPVPADYDGDRKADLAVWTPSNGQFFVLKSTGGIISTPVGAAGQIPVPADYNGDGIADLGVFAPNGAVWFILFSGGGTLNTSLGAAGTFQFPLPTDYDGDGKADLAVRVPSTGFYLVQKSTGGFQSNNIGNSTAIPLAKRPQYAIFYPYDEKPEEKRP